jgi:hypothetical protein
MDVRLKPAGRPRDERSRRCAAVAFAGLLVAAVAVVALHFLRTDLAPSHRHLSEYAVGEWGALMTTAFLAAAAGAAALAVVFSTEVAPSRWLRVACGAIVAAALCEAALAVFVTDLSVPAPGEPWVRTTHGRVHDVLALLHGIAWTIAVFVLPIALRRDARWRGFVRVSWCSALAVLATVATRAVSPPVWINFFRSSLFPRFSNKPIRNNSFVPSSPVKCNQIAP